LALGLTLLLAVEALVNAGMALALLPTKGMALRSVVRDVVGDHFLHRAGAMLSVSGGPGGFLRRARSAAMRLLVAGGGRAATSSPALRW